MGASHLIVRVLNRRSKVESPPASGTFSHLTEGR